MDFRTDPETTAFARVLGAALGRAGAHGPAPGARKRDDDHQLWRTLGDLGLWSLAVPEALGGYGGTASQLTPLLREAGRHAAPQPVIESLVALYLLGLLPASQRRDAWLRAAMAGETVIVADVDGPLVNGAASAGGIVMADNGELWGLDRDEAQIREHDHVDPARRVARVARQDGTLLLGGTDAARLIAEASELGRLYAAAQLLGLAERMLELTVGYARVRTQFGRPIGSFQAVQHHLADVAIALELARPVVWRAANSVTHREVTARRDVAMAKVFANDAAAVAAKWSLFVHGAIGYTEEYALHSYLVQSLALQAEWGGSLSCRRVVEEALRA